VRVPGAPPLCRRAPATRSRHRGCQRTADPIPWSPGSTRREAAGRILRRHCRHPAAPITHRRQRRRQEAPLHRRLCRLTIQLVSFRGFFNEVLCWGTNLSIGTTCSSLSIGTTCSSCQNVVQTKKLIVLRKKIKMLSPCSMSSNGRINNCSC
jgi:hypothetical protein